MTGDKILQLNSKISPNFARLKHSELPKHAQVLLTNDVSPVCTNGSQKQRGADGPFSDLDQQTESRSKTKYRYLQRALNDYSNNMPTSHSEDTIGTEFPAMRTNGATQTNGVQFKLCLDQKL